MIPESSRGKRSTVVTYAMGVLTGIGLMSACHSGTGDWSFAGTGRKLRIEEGTEGSVHSLIHAENVDQGGSQARRSSPIQKGPRRISSFLKQNGVSAGNMATPKLWTHGVKGKVVVDVGANNGKDYAIPAVKEGRHVVYAFEPAPSAFNKLMSCVKNAGIMDRTTVVDVTPGQKIDMEKIKSVNVDRAKGHLFIIKAAAAAETGKSKLVIAPADEMSYVSSSSVNLDFTNRAQTVDIALVRLDDIVDEDLLLLKSDAQGYDMEVFKGARRLLEKRHVEMINTEYTPKVMEGFAAGSSVQFLEFLSDHGFACFDWSDNKHVPLSRPSDFPGFAGSFMSLCGSGETCNCQDDKCFHRSLGKWDELACVNVNAPPDHVGSEAGEEG